MNKLLITNYLKKHNLLHVKDPKKLQEIINLISREALLKQVMYAFMVVAATIVIFMIKSHLPLILAIITTLLSCLVLMIMHDFRSQVKRALRESGH